MIPFLSVKASAIKLKVKPLFPSNVYATSPLTLTKIDGNFTFGLDINALQASLIPIFAANYVPLAGGTMTGPLILNADPVAVLGAVTKQYVDRNAREKLAAPRTYFISNAGLDTNNGTSAGTPFLTIQKAIDVIGSLDININDVTIQCATGTYAKALVTAPWLGKGVVTLVGDVATPANCTINSTAGDCLAADGSGARLKVQGFKITNSDASSAGIAVRNGGTITISGKMKFGRCAFACFNSQSGGAINFDAIAAPGHSIDPAGAGNQTGMFWCQGGGAQVNVNGAVNWKLDSALTVTSAFFHSSTSACANVPAMVFDTSSFGVTGKRFNVDNLAQLQTFTGNANYFPGTAVGTGTTPGVAPYGLYG